MPALVLTLLKLIFLALIYLFVWQVARALVRYLGVSDPKRSKRAGARLVVVRSDAQPGLDVTVRDVMTPAVHQVPATAPVAEAARIMVEHHIHRLVVTRGHEPVGIITSIDLLRVLAEQSSGVP